MKIKNVYIYTEDSERDYKFRQEDIKKNNIRQENVFTDISFESAYMRDILQGFGGWKQVRMLDANGKEIIYVKVNE